MASITVLKSIGVLIASLCVGMGLYYLTYQGSTKEKKQILESVSSYIIQFIIYIWLGKIVAAFPTAINDPIAVLAYPANSKAFYLATVFTIVHLMIQYKRKKLQIEPIIEGFAPIFLMSSFFYEFLQIMMKNNQLDIYFIWVMVLSVVAVIVYQKEASAFSGSILMGIWSLGTCILSILNGYVVIFGFLLQPLYFMVICIGFGGYGLVIRKKDINNVQA